MMDLDVNIRVSRIVFHLLLLHDIDAASHKQVNIKMVFWGLLKGRGKAEELKLRFSITFVASTSISVEKYVSSTMLLTVPSPSSVCMGIRGLDATHLWLWNSWQASGLVTHLPRTKSWGNGEAETADGSAGAPCSLAGEEKMAPFHSFCVDPCQVSWCLHVFVIWLVHCQNFCLAIAWNTQEFVREEEESNILEESLLYHQLVHLRNADWWTKFVKSPIIYQWDFGRTSWLSSMLRSSKRVLWRWFWCKLRTRCVI